MENNDKINAHIKGVLHHKKQARELNNGKDLIDNYGWREYSMWDTMRGDYPTLDLLIGRTGPDYSCSEIGTFSGEMKSCQFDPPKTRNYITESLGKGEFDKQTDPLRREETLQYDGFIFGLFERDEYTPVVLLHVNTPFGVQKVRQVIHHKHTQIIEKIALHESLGKKMPRDSITVEFKDVYTNLTPYDYEVYYNGQKMDTAVYLSKLRNQQIYIPKR